MASQILRLLVCSILILTAESHNEVLDEVKELPEWKYFVGFMEETERKIYSLSRMEHGSEVAFQVQHSGVPEIVQAPNTVKYDNILVNKRLGYNNETGKFICRKNGLYFFGYSSLPTRGIKTEVTLMKDGTPTSRIHSKMESTNVQATMRSIILYLHKGDRVWVEVTKGSVWSKGDSITFQGFHLP